MNLQVSHIKRRSECPISFGLDMFGDKWTLLVLRDMLLFNRSRFSDFAPRERIATNILADRLNRLEKAGIITKKRDKNLKNQYVYTATEKGWRLLPTIIEMMFWGFQYDSETPASKKYIKRIKTEKDELMREAMRAAKQGKFIEYRQREIGVKL